MARCWNYSGAVAVLKGTPSQLLSAERGVELIGSLINLPGGMRRHSEAYTLFFVRG
jgi:hypothetical protein